VSVDPQGLAFIAFASDANDFAGHTVVTHQTKGLNLHTGKRVSIAGGDKEPSAVRDPEVRDWKWDARFEVRPPQSPEVDHPSDIVSVDYGCELTRDRRTLVTARMVTSGLTSTPPPDAFWRMNFASNPTQPGVSDRADQWFLRADTDADGRQTFTWGTAVRTSTGGIAYTARGAADDGRFDAGTRSVTVKVDLAKLAPFSARGPLGVGTTFIGLRGSSQTLKDFQTTVAGLVTAGATVSDTTRGGSSFTLGESCFPR
jgi:hypothetical protein